MELPDDVPTRWYDEIDSTNLEAFRRIGKGATPSIWYRAGRQTLGRGTRGRPWTSDAGNLFASLHIRPNCAPAALPQISLLTGVAAVAAIESLPNRFPQPRRLCLKWPNDLLHRGAKVCGILVESRPVSGQAVHTHDVVIGIGINVSSHPPATAGIVPAGNLVAAGWTADADAVFASLATSMRDWLRIWRNGEGFNEVRAAWLARACFIGTQIEIETADGRLTGRLEGIDERGALLVADEDGDMITILSGHILAAEGLRETTVSTNE